MDLGMNHVRRETRIEFSNRRQAVTAGWAPARAGWWLGRPMSFRWCAGLPSPTVFVESVRARSMW